MASATASSSSSASQYRVNYSEYVADITGSPKTARKLPSNNAVTSAVQHINSPKNPSPKGGKQPTQTATGMPSYGGSAEKCARCSKTVYLAEKRIGASRPFHSQCFSCKTCHRKLDSATLSEHKGEIYCKACYTRQFGVHGLVSGVTMTTGGSRRESRPTRRSSFGSDLDAPLITHQPLRPRAHSNDNILRGEVDAIRHDEAQRLFPWRDAVLPEQHYGPPKNEVVEVRVEKRPTRPSSQIGFEKIAETTVKVIDEGDAHRSTYFGEEDRRQYISEGEKVSYGKGTAALVDMPAVSPSSRVEHSIGFVALPNQPTRTREQNRSPSPSFSTGSYGRQNSRERQIDIAIDSSRVTQNEDNRGDRYSTGNATNAITTGNPLIKETHYRSSSQESKHISSTSSASAAINYDWQSSRARDPSPSAFHPINRPSSPSSGHVSPSTAYTSSSTRDPSYMQGSPSSSTYAPQYDYVNLQPSTSSSHSDAVNRRPSSPSRSDVSPSAMNHFMAQTHDLAPNMSPAAGGRYNALGALYKPI